MPPSLLESQVATLEPLAPDEPGTGVDTTGSPAAVAERALHTLGVAVEGGAEARGAGDGPHGP